MKENITDFNQIKNNNLYNKSFNSFIRDLFKFRKAFDFDSPEGMYNFIVGKMKRGKQCFFNTSYIIGTTIGNKNVEFDIKNIEGIGYSMKRKIANSYDRYSKMEAENKEKMAKGEVTLYKRDNSTNKKYIEKTITNSYTELLAESDFNSKVIESMGVDRLVFYDLETTVTKKTLLLGYFTSIDSKGNIRNTFLLNEEFSGTFFEGRVKTIVNEINEKYYPEFKIATYYRFMDQGYKESLLKAIDEKKSIFIGYNSLGFDNMVMAKHMLDKSIDSYITKTDIIHKKMNKVSMDLFEFYSEQKENCALDVILKNNLKDAKKLMTHEKLLPMLSFDFLNDIDNQKDTDSFIYYNIFDVLLIMLLFFKNFKQDSFGYKHKVSKETYIEYIKKSLKKLDEK